MELGFHALFCCLPHATSASGVVDEPNEYTQSQRRPRARGRDRGRSRTPKTNINALFGFSSRATLDPSESTLEEDEILEIPTSDTTLKTNKRKRRLHKPKRRRHRSPRNKTGSIRDTKVYGSHSKAEEKGTMHENKHGKKKRWQKGRRGREEDSGLEGMENPNEENHPVVYDTIKRERTNDNSSVSTTSITSTIDTQEERIEVTIESSELFRGGKHEKLRPPSVLVKSIIIFSQKVNIGRTHMKNKLRRN